MAEQRGLSHRRSHAFASRRFSSRSSIAHSRSLHDIDGHHICMGPPDRTIAGTDGDSHWLRRLTPPSRP